MSRLSWAAAIATILALASPSLAADYHVDGKRLFVSGIIHGDDEFATFARYVRDNPAVTTIVMKDFYGGMVRAGSFVHFPQFIREHKLATEVDGPCVSACALAFLGGVKRGLAPGADPKASFVAFHGIYNGDGRRAEEFKGTFLNALRRYTGGRMPEAVALRAFLLPQDGLLMFFDGRRIKGKKGISVVMCENVDRRDTCIGIEDLDAVATGVFTR